LQTSFSFLRESHYFYSRSATSSLLSSLLSSLPDGD
jgi:hypothetical protein